MLHLGEEEPAHHRSQLGDPIEDGGTGGGLPAVDDDLTIERTVRGIVTRQVGVGIGVAEVESPMRAENRKADEQYAAERAKLEADPNVQALKDMFGAELNPDSIKLNNPSQE